MSTPRTSTARRGAGAPPPRGVLWRRRVVAVALLAALVVALVLLGQVVVRAVQPMLGGGAPQEGRTAPPTPEAAGPPQDCGAASLELSVAPAKAEFTENEAVALAVTMRHVGARPCLVDGSDAVRRVLVRSGDELVWSSAHCASGENLLLMSRGDEVAATVRWDMRRSVEGCAPDQPVAAPGTYTALVSVAGVDGATSDPATFTILGPAPAETEQPADEPTDQPADEPTDQPADEPATEGDNPAEQPAPPADEASAGDGTAAGGSPAG
ncbi:hypothetical protein [Cellulosimicrobium sp. Marseille-Q8652]